MTNKIFILVTVTAMAAILAGCTKEPPKCSDDKTTDLVRKIILDQIGGSEGLTEKEIKDNMKIEYPRASAFDEKIKKYSCEAKLVAGNTYQLPITYESQLDDNGKHIVTVGGIRTGDLYGVKAGINEVIKKNKAASSETATINSQENSQDVASKTKPEEVTNTRFGSLVVKDVGEYGKGLFYASKVLYKREFGFLSIDKVYQVDNSDVVLISDSEGGSGTIDSHFFVTLSQNANPVVSESFVGQGSEIQVVQNKSQLAADLGYDNGFHKVMTYQNGKVAIQKTDARKKKSSADESDCNYLYKDIYSSYVDQKECQGAPEEVSGMATARAYYSMQNDPRLNLKAFQVIAKDSCKKRSTMNYAEFQKKVCGK